MNGIAIAQILATRNMIRPHLPVTPLLPSNALGRRANATIHLKMECWQHTGSFKTRGALAKLSTLTPDQIEGGMVTASAGNHGLGVAYAARVLDLPAIQIFVPENAPQAKVNRLAAFNCQIRRAGIDYDSAHALAHAHAQEHGATYLSAYDDPVVVAGQATAGLEILEALPDTDILLVPVGGGGLIAGIAIVARAINPNVRIIGLQPEASPSAYLSLRDGRAHETYPAGPTICDGLAGGFGRVPFELAGHLIERILIVPENAIRTALGWLVAHEQVIVEGSGAIAIAPLLTGQLDVEGQTVVAVLTGRNIDAGLLSAILAEQEAQTK